MTAEAGERLAVTDRRQVGAGPVGMVLELGQLMRPRVRRGHALTLQEMQRLTRLEVLLKDEAPAGGEGRAHHHHQARRPEERERAPYPDARVEPELLREPPALDGRPTVRVQDTLRGRRRARRIDNEG